MQGNEYISRINGIISKAWNSQTETVDIVSDLILQITKNKNNIFVFGCSHAGIIAEEVFYRSGGFVTINPVFFPGFMLNTRPVTMTSQLERVVGLGTVIIKENNIKSGDLLIIHSVSGRNTVPVEMALFAKESGITTVALTNVKYSSSVDSRHPSGKRLFEVADCVIDNCGSVGDAEISIDGLPEKIGPTSTVVGAALMNAVIIDSVEKMIGEGIIPPVFMSANIDGGTEHNYKILEEYKDNIFYM